MGNIASADRIAEIERRFLRDMVATEDYSFGAARQAIAELHAELRAALAARDEAEGRTQEMREIWVATVQAKMAETRRAIAAETALTVAHKALRDLAITNTRGPWRDQRQWHACKVCGGSWASEDPEQHEGNCTAMVSA